MSRADEIIEILKKDFPDAHCELNYGSDFQLLVAVILSAQCTDKRVNLVTAELFKKYATPLDFVQADTAEIENAIRSCGFFRSKAKSIQSASADILQKYGGEVPRTFDELTSLRGVGRKTANVMLSVAFGEATLAVDTHVFRTAHRLGLSDEATPEGVEKELTSSLSAENLAVAHHLLIFHGRYRCHSKSPACEGCTLNGYCGYKR